MIPKKFAGIFTVLFTIIFSLCSLTNSYATETVESQFLKNVRQLTYEGKRAGEGYFSEDGKALIFQSERKPENPFFQIYLLDFETGDTNRVSPGTGKTTCSFCRPAPTRRSLLRPTLTQKHWQNNRQKLNSVPREKNVALPGITMNTTISSRHSGTGAN